MWFVAIIVLYANGVMGKSMCEKPHFIACDYPFSPGNFPGTVRELEELCPLAKNYYDCIKDYGSKCSKRPLFLDGQYESIKNLIVDVCSNGTSIHTAVFENVKCIKDRVTNRGAECNADSHQVLNAFKDLEKAKGGKKEDSVSHMMEACVFFTYDMGCFMTSASNKCGTTVKDAIIDGTNRSYFLRSQCSVQDLNKLRDVANKLNISDAQKNILNESLRTLSWTA